MRTPPLYVIVSPVRDEAAHIAQTLQSVVGQTVRPAKWVIVDDGSKDDTGSIVDSYAARHPWIDVIHCADRGHRVAGGGVMDAFYVGFARVEHDAWDFAAKLDGDVSFHPDYFQRCLEHFATDPRLGIGGGTVFTPTKEGLRTDSVGDPPFHVRGTAKIYRRACFQQIGPLVKAPGWDTLDEVRANLLGWSTRTFPDVGMVRPQADGKRLRVLGGRLQERESELHQRLSPCLHACEVRKAHVLQALRRASGRPWCRLSIRRISRGCPSLQTPTRSTS